MPPKIYNIKEPLNLDRLRLAKPVNKNGSHFIKTLDIDNPIYFLCPKCFSKNGFVKSGKKIFCDFVFSNEDSDFLSWLENLEENARNSIYKNRESWFETPLDEHDIESSMSSPYKPYKSGKYFIVRANVPTVLDKINIKIYDEAEKETDPENIKENTKVLAVLEFQGIRCSVRSFQFEIELKQLLIVEPDKLFEKCIIGSSLKDAHPKNQHGSSPSSNSNYVSTNHADKDSEPTLLEEINSEYRSEEFHVADNLENISNSINLNDKLDIPPINLNSSTIVRTPELRSSVGVRGLSGDGLPSKDNDALTYEDESSPLPHISLELCPRTPTLVPHSGVLAITETSLNVPIEIVEHDFALEDIAESNSEIEPQLKLKSRNDVYYKLYKEMRQRAKEAKREALANYLEAKRIKNTHFLEDLSDSESDDDLTNDSK